MQAVITGASSGIGKEMAILLSQKGYDLILVGRRRELMEKICFSTNVKIFSYDLSKEEEVFSFYHEIEQEEIDVFINNAGFGVYGEFLESPLSQELQMLATNVTAVHILSKLILEKFQTQNHGCLMNVASSAAFYSAPLLCAYYATKSYVYRLTMGIYEELRQKKSPISVSVLCPGPVKTDFNRVAGLRPFARGLESKAVAEYAIKQMFRKKTVIVPGILMKLGRFFAPLLPEKFLLRFLYQIQKKKV